MIQSPAVVSGSSAAPVQFEKLEIHKVCLRFPNFHLRQNLSLTTLVDRITGYSEISSGRKPLWSVLRASVGVLDLVELEAAVDRLLDVSGALDRVAVGVEADGAGDRVDGQAGQRVADGGAVGGLGTSISFFTI